MNRLFTFICIVLLLLFHTSCNEEIMELESSDVELKTRATEQKVHNLIQQARYGDADAYNSLALCYRDGDGVDVDKSWLNMICMYANYYKRTGKDVEEVIGLLEERHPFKLFLDALDSSFQDDEFMERVEILRNDAPSEAKAIKVAYDLNSDEKSVTALNALREAEDEGSELAVLLQVLYYEEKDMKDDYEQCLIRLVGKYPFFNLKIGELYVERYWKSKDFSDIQKAMEYYYKADAYAMLTPRFACGLISIYEHFGKEGLLRCDEQEIKRLKNIANIND